MDEQKPYYNAESPANAAVWPPAPMNAQPEPAAVEFDDIRAFQTQNVLLLILLSVCTLWLYSYFWMLRTVKTFNKIAPERPVSPGFVWIGLAVWVLFLVFGFYVDSLPGTHQQLEMDIKIFGRLDELYSLRLAYVLRDSLNYILISRQQQPGTVGRPWTFFFNIFYLQHRINREALARQRERAAAQGASKLSDAI